MGSELRLSKDAHGAYVITVRDDGPSKRSGLRGGDKDTKIVVGVGAKGPVYLPGGGDLIISIDDQAVKTFDDVLVYLENYGLPGDTVTLTVLRPGERRIQVARNARRTTRDAVSSRQGNDDKQEGALRPFRFLIYVFSPV